MALFHSFYDWVIFHCIYAPLLIHSSVDGDLVCFHVLAIVNSAVVNIGVHLSFWILVLSICPRVRLQDHHTFSRNHYTIIANTLFQQHKRRLYTWTSTGGQHRNQIDYILCSQRWRSSIQSAKTRLGVDCGSDHELLIAKFILKLKKVGKTTRPFRYDLNQIPYDYTVEVRNRFKGLDLIECLMN